MATPHRIGSLSQFAFPYHTQRVGPFEIGSNLYVCLADISAGSKYARMMKSTDGGSTWTEQNAAGAPQIYDAFGSGNRLIDVSQLSSDLHLAYAAPGGTAATVAFSSDTWGTPDTGGPSVGALADPRIQRFWRLLKSDGNSVFFYNNSTPDFKAVDLTGGVWGTPFNVKTGAFGYGGAVDSADRMIVFYDQTGGSDPGMTVKAKTYTAGGTLSSEIAVIEDGVGVMQLMGLPMVATIGGTDYVMFGYGKGILFSSPAWVATATQQGHAALVIAACADSPTFTDEQVNFLNNVWAFGHQPGTCDWAVTVGADGRPRIAWLSNSGKLMAAYYNIRHAQELWEPVNTLLYTTLDDATSPVRKQVTAIQGRYLSGRDKHAYIIEIDGASDSGIYYVEAA